MAAACGGGDDGDEVEAPVVGTEVQRELAQRYWEWVADAPAEADPLSDPDGSACTTGQPDDVWFLASSFGETLERTCQVPAGRPIFAAVIAQTCSPRQTTCAIAGATAEATLDGQPVPVTEIATGRFSVKGAPDNVITLSTEGVELISAGHYVELAPLDPGEHTLRLVGTDEAGFVSDVTYRIVVG